MSKAKELATSLQEIIEHEKGDWHELKATAYDLIEAVLSEPDEPCGLKGWIEIGETPYRQLIHLSSGKIYEEFLGSPERVRVQGYGGYIDINSTFEELKQKIKEAS